MTDDVIVVGGGVVGLSIAYALATEGVSVRVLDRGPLGREASWAGAGILAPPSGGQPREPLSALRTLSARLYPEWSAALREETGIDNGYRACGGLDVAATAEQDAQLRALSDRWSAEGIPFERLEPNDFGRVEPLLSPAFRSAYFLPGMAQIRNPRHVRALTVACMRKGVHLEPGRATVGFDRQGERVTAVQTKSSPLHCERVVIAAGAWSEGLLDNLGLRLPTPPVRGQIVLLRTDRPFLGRVVELGHQYLVPRDDGRVLVGSTEEYAGFQARTTAEAIGNLIGLATRLCPALGQAEVERAWAGLRPGNLDGRPTLGPAPGLANVFIATGHQRVGLQLSTGTAMLLADLIQGRPPRIDLAAFRLGREPEPLEDLFRS